MMLERLFHLSSAVLAVALLRGLAVLAAGYAVTALAKRLSSEAKHLIWLGVIASFLLIPLAWLLLPPLRLGAGIAVEPGSALRLAAAPMMSGKDYALLVDKGMEYAALAGTQRPLPYGLTSLALLAVWFSGVMFLLVRFLLGTRRLKRLAFAANRNDHLWNQARELAHELSVRRNISVLLSPRCSIPFTFGLRRPVILLPLAATTWPAGRLRSALIHELVHVRRRDVIIQSAAYGVCLLFWFIPPLWLAYGALLREAEACCDQEVINRGVQVPKYARDIVELAWGCEGRVLLPTISSALGRKSLLKERIKNILRLRPGRPALGIRGLARVAIIGLACLLPLLAVTGSRRPSAAGLDDAFIGTWINPEYDGYKGKTSSKFVVYPDGRELDYLNISDLVPTWDYQDTVEDKWIDQQGNRWYKIHCTGGYYGYDSYRFKSYALVRINAAGTVSEFVCAEGRYPEEFSPIGGAYSIFYRQ
jgi:beta-lactamase regulating signal transducer with metallopeptidase domain